MISHIRSRTLCATRCMVTTDIFASSVFLQIANHDQINAKLVLRNAVPDIATGEVERFPLKETCIKSPVLRPLLFSFVLGRS